MFSVFQWNAYIDKYSVTSPPLWEYIFTRDWMKTFYLSFYDSFAYFWHYPIISLFIQGMFSKWYSFWNKGTTGEYFLNAIYSREIPYFTLHCYIIPVNIEALIVS